MAELIEIASPMLSASINPFGAELTSLRDPQGRELMTDADPAFWTGRAPILFPIVGRLNGDALRIDGAEYPMPKHGFARHSAFEVIACEAGRAAFRLTDSEESRAAYPFAFALDLAFAIDHATLEIEARITNRGDTPMPASFGFHPAFAWPLLYGRARTDHRIVIDADEPGALWELTTDGLIAPAKRASPLDGRTLHLADALFEKDALIWDPVHSSAVRYGASDSPQLDIAFPDTPRLGIWTKPGAQYVCVELWHGIADPDGFAGDFRDKPGVFEIAPGEAKRIGMTVTLVAEP